MTDGQTRIFDFYLLFPFFLPAARLNRELRSSLNLLTRWTATRPYGEQPSAETIYRSMQPIQDASFQTLVTKGMFDMAAFQRGDIQRTATPLRERLELRIANLNSAENELLNFLNRMVRSFRFEGPDGLKHRTNLAEYRYDSV